MMAPLPFEPRPAAITRIAMPAAVTAVAPAVEQAIALSAAGGEALLAGAQTDAMRLALTEALNNVLEHAAHDVRLPVYLHVATSWDVPWIVVEDGGKPLPDAIFAAPEATPAEAPDYATMPLDALPEGGWGWMLIRASIGQLDYVRAESRNYLLLAAPVESDPAMAG